MKDKQTVLVVDDEPKILELLKSYLEMNGFTARCAKTAGEGMAIFERQRLDCMRRVHTPPLWGDIKGMYPEALYLTKTTMPRRTAGSSSAAGLVDLILLDLMLPDFSGEEFCKKVRQVSDVPIIMITAKIEEESIIHGLNIGADDYVTKPFSPRQLMARVQAALRRGGGTETRGAFLACGDLVADTEKRTVSRNGQALALTRDEYNILVLLMSRQAKIFTRDEILDAIKGDDFDGFDRAVDSHIKRLRAKIGDDPRAPRYILTVYGMGYRIGEV